MVEFLQKGVSLWKRYSAIEKRLKGFAGKVKIAMHRLDLVLLYKLYKDKGGGELLE